MKLYIYNIATPPELEYIINNYICFISGSTVIEGLIITKADIPL